jgi:hypothetical protein
MNGLVPGSMRPSGARLSKVPAAGSDARLMTEAVIVAWVCASQVRILGR